MSYYYLFRKYGVCALSQKRTLSRKNYFKVMTSSRMYKIFVILAILMTSSSDDVIKFSIFEFCNSFTIIVWSYCENIKCLSLTTLKLLLFSFWFFSVFSQFWGFIFDHLSVKNQIKFLLYIYQAKIFTEYIRLNFTHT